MNVLVLMAGSSDEFYKEGSLYPKYLFEIEGKPLIEHVIENLSPIASHFIFLINKEDAEKWHLDDVVSLLKPESKVIVVEGQTKGAACTALYAIDYINNQEELLIANGDQILNINLPEAIEKLRAYDGGTITFNSVHPRWSYVKLDKNSMIVQAEEKRPISKYATAGIYYFKRGREFVFAASNSIKKWSHVNGFFYICPSFNELILQGKKLGVYHEDRESYHSLASLEGVRSYISFLKRNRTQHER